jgi:aldehyde oxidoreductase
MQRVTLNVNGLDRYIVADGEQLLADVLRNQLMLTGCKATCREGQCGACSVIMDGKIVRGCLVKMKKVPAGAKILTIEGIGTADDLHPLQVAWMAQGAAQCGICSPGFIMAAKALLDVDKNPTREEVRDFWHKNRNACRCTGYKPLVDAVMDAAKVMRGEMKKEDLLFQPVDNGSILGSMYHRPSALQKVTGTWDFGADIAMHMPPDTLRLALVQAEVSHANIKGICTAEAEKMPGVHKVVTWKDVKGKNAITGLITFPTNKGDGWDRPILCKEKVFQFGDAIAIVCADTEEQARAAAKKVKVDLEVLPAYMSGPAAMASDAIEIHPGVPNVYYEQRVVKGQDTKSIMEKAPYVVEDEFYCSRQPHLTIEPDCGQAFLDDQGVLTIQSKSIGLHLHHAMICPGLGIPPEKLRIIQNPTGGTFGYKFSPTLEALVGVACLATGRPVSLNYDMFQGITYTGKRSPVGMKLKLAADKNGKLVAMESDWWVDHGPYSEFGDLLTQRQAQFTGAGYMIPNIRSLGKTVCTNHAWGSAFRSYGSPQAFLASECLMDELAEKMGVDPFELRYRNIYRPGDTTPNGCKPDVYCFEAMFDKLRPRYEEAKKRCKQLSTPEKRRGVGLALGIYGSGLDGPDSSSASAELLKDGCVLLRNTWQDHGQAGDLGTQIYAHEVLRKAGFRPEQIKLDINDTRAPDSGPSGGSRQNVMTGHAITIACQMLLKAMQKPNGKYRTYQEMVAENIPLKYDGKWVVKDCQAISAETGQGNPFSVYMYELFMPEVEVDTKTGEVTVVKFTTVADVGTVISKATVDGQIYGGLAQGIGLALSEDFDDLTKHTNLLKCGIPYPKDIPDDMEIIYNVTPRPNGPHGAAGVGEAPLTSPHAAILNAVYNACGVRITRVPALPAVVKAGLEKLRASR